MALKFCFKVVFHSKLLEFFYRKFAWPNYLNCSLLVVIYSTLTVLFVSMISSSWILFSTAVLIFSGKPLLSASVSDSYCSFGLPNESVNWLLWKTQNNYRCILPLPSWPTGCSNSREEAWIEEGTNHLSSGQTNLGFRMYVVWHKY